MERSNASMPFPRRRWGAVFLAAFVVFAGCASTEMIKDIRELPQDNAFYLDPATADRPILSPDLQKQCSDRYDERFFSPWRQTQTRYAREEITYDIQHYAKNPGYGENKRRHPHSWIRALAANAHFAAYPNAGAAAIAVVNTDFRVLPTAKPHFDSVQQAGAGYPFDNLQNSAISANTPLFVSHVSWDRAWVFAETAYAFGWVPSRDVAYVDDDFRNAWECGAYAVAVQDKVAVHSEGNRYLFHAPLGALFPLAGRDGDRLRVLVALADEGQRAIIRTAVLPAKAAAPKPIPLTQARVARLANELINEPYGWGGLYRNRDCSATVMDLFAPFGIWLPRNSAKQAREGGRFVDLQNMPPDDKEQRIIAEGVPYLTLLWLRGHIMLYIGARQGKALVFHNLWGLRTQDLLGREGRKIVGHAAITTLRPGIELWNYDIQRGDLLQRILGMTILGQSFSASGT